MTATRRYLVVTLGSAGDLHPALGLARGLGEEGHRVEVMTNAPYRSAVEAEGLGFSALGSLEDHERTASHPDLWHPIRGFGVLWRHLGVPAIEPVFQRVNAFLDEGPAGEPAPRVLASPLAVGARLARMTRSFALCSLYTAPSNLRSISDPMYVGAWRVPQGTPPFVRSALWWGLDRWKLEPMARPALARSSARLGVRMPRESIFGRWIHSPDGGLTLFPAWFCPRQDDWPKGIEMGAFPLFEGADRRELSPTLERFLSEGPRPVVIFPGSVVGAEGIALVRQSLTACRALGLRAVVLGLADPAWTAAVQRISTDTFLRCDHAPLSRLLRQSRVFIHHGGIGSCAQGLYQRVPQLIQPRAFDQFENAERVELEGGGRTVPPGTGLRGRFLSMLEDLGGGGAGAILDRAGGQGEQPDSTSTLPKVLDALRRWESNVSEKGQARR